MCLSAWQCCPEQSAFSELYGGEAGEPLQICRALCVTDCLVCARFEPSSRLSTLHPLANSRGDLFQVSPQDLAFFSPHGAAEKKLERSPPSHPKGKQIKVESLFDFGPKQDKWLLGSGLHHIQPSIPIKVLWLHIPPFYAYWCQGCFLVDMPAKFYLTWSFIEHTTCNMIIKDRIENIT